MGVGRWTAIGLGQAALYGLLTGLQGLLQSPRTVMTMDRAARGLGKVLWWGPFKTRFYGRPVR
jgi:succinoglycan biosynthesis protein ExoM